MSRSTGEDNPEFGDTAQGSGVEPIPNSQSSPNHRSERKKHRDFLGTPKDKMTPVNAFAMMMSGGKTGSGKKRKRSNISGSKNGNPTTTTSKFVPCPVCGNHILPHEMNKHLDICLLKQSMKRKQEQMEKESLQSKSQPENEHQTLDQTEFVSATILASITPVEGTPPKVVPLVSSTPPAEITKNENSDQVIEVHDPGQQNSPTSVASKTTTVADKNEPKPNNAFAHMMKSSAKVFSEQEAASINFPKLFERMHLHQDGRVSLTCYRANRMVPLDESIAWSATIQVRGKKERGIPPIDLLVSSSIPSSVSSSSNPNEPQRIRLVRKHSRLSVPVLKSILQKGIRRRKPLPSVRVAAELADKSLGDLLRRLPIIVLEDSTLHPDLPFLVWLMMAVSKDFQPPLALLKKVLGVVFEMASCRWQDSLSMRSKKESGEEEEKEKAEILTLASLHKRATASSENEADDSRKQNYKDVVLNDDELIVWSMLMRAQYGGMACDIRMLQGFADVWHERFHSTQSIPSHVKKRLSPRSNGVSSVSRFKTSSPSATPTASVHQKVNANDQGLRKWNQVPGFVHKSAVVHSASRIDCLLMAPRSQSQPPSLLLAENNSDHQCESHVFVGLPALARLDLTSEGVDFHCSCVLESAVLGDTSVVKECFVKLANGRVRLRAAGQDRRSWLEGLLKSCMWKFSGGVNFRMPLVGTTNDRRDEDSDLKDFYDTLIKPRVDAFVERYIDERISKYR